jgi:hypothetical protein
MLDNHSFGVAITADTAVVISQPVTEGVVRCRGHCSQAVLTCLHYSQMCTHLKLKLYDLCMAYHQFVPGLLPAPENLYISLPFAKQ